MTFESTQYSDAKRHRLVLTPGASRHRLGSLATSALLLLGCVGSIGSTPASEPGPTEENGPSSPRQSGGNTGLPTTPSPAAPSTWPADCSRAPLPRRIWKLTSEQVENTLAALVRPAPSVVDRLRATVAESGGGFSHKASGQDMSAPHIARLYEVAREVADAALRPGGPAAACAAAGASESCAESFIRTFGARAFRRPLRPEEQERFRAFFAQKKSASGSSEALRQVVRGFLLSPHFLYRTELGPLPGDPGDSAAGDTVVLTPFEQASAMAYLISDGPPDEELIAAAAAGALTSPAQRAQHVQRLLASPTTSSGVRRFLAEHLRLRGAAGLTNRDRDLYPEFNSTLAADLAREMELFVDSVLWKGDGRWPTLLTSPTTWINGRLARLYGAAGVTGEGFMEIMLNAQQRAGILTRGGWLALLADAHEGSIVARGRFVRERLLCDTIPPPPPDVNAVPPPPDGVLTHRERLVRHSADARCAGCHALMDPIGFGFEHYDAIGRFRLMDAGKPVDPSGFFLDQSSGARHEFADAIELSGFLARSPAASACLVRQLVTYAEGRASLEETPCAPSLVAAFEQSGGDLKALVVALSTADEFFIRMR